MSTSCIEPEPPSHLGVGHASAATILAAAAQGDPNAWRELTDRYERGVLRVAARYRLRPDQIADVAQTTWLRLVENIDTIRDPDCLAGWLATTAAREAMAVRRRACRETALADYDLPDPSGDDLDERVTTLVQARQLRTAMRALPVRDRRLLELLLLPDELSYREIGQRISMPVGSIGPIRQRALRRLRVLLVDQADPGSDLSLGGRKPPADRELCQAG